MELAVAVIIGVAVALLVVRWLARPTPPPSRIEIVAANTYTEAQRWVAEHRQPHVTYQLWNVNLDYAPIRGHQYPIVHVVGSLTDTFQLADYPALQATEPFIEWDDNAVR